jgi:2,3-diketo-5-methylthio-1-phosphopentane phosphatase
MLNVKVVCDFDGTIALEDVTDSLLDRFADSSWRDIEREWLSGRFGSRECMARQVALIQARLEDLDCYLDTVRIDPFFLSFVEHCDNAANVSLTVISDGIDYAVGRILGNHSLSHLQVKANALIAISGDRYRLDFPYASADCVAHAGNCKCAIACSRPRTPMIVIGDGTSDFCIASRADFVFARDRLLTHCQVNGIAHLPFDNFLDISHELRQVVGVFASDPERSPVDGVAHDR